MKYHKYVHTRFGLFLLESENGALTGAKPVLNEGDNFSCSLLETAEKALRDYENGIKSRYVVHVFPKCTPFQLMVLREISKIPFGETASYSEIAERIGKKGACRAIGNALSRNPVLLFIPCHRVVGKNGALTGFAGGLPIKQMLLEHEKTYFANNSAICTAFVAAPFLT